MKSLDYRLALGNEADLITPTSTQQYPLGSVVTILDSDKTMVKKYLYVCAGAALSAYLPYTIDWTGTAGDEVTTKTPIALVGVIIGVPQVAFTSGYFGFVQTMGDCLVSGNLTSGNCLRVKANAATVLTDQSTTTVGTDTVAIAKETKNAVGVKAILLGRSVTVSAS
jgi:hypothetical protein